MKLTNDIKLQLRVSKGLWTIFSEGRMNHLNFLYIYIDYSALNVSWPPIPTRYTNLAAEHVEKFRPLIVHVTRFHVLDPMFRQKKIQLIGIYIYMHIYGYLETFLTRKWNYPSKLGSAEEIIK